MMNFAIGAFSMVLVLTAIVGIWPDFLMPRRRGMHLRQGWEEGFNAATRGDSDDNPYGE